VPPREGRTAESVALGCALAWRLVNEGHGLVVSQFEPETASLFRASCRAYLALVQVRAAAGLFPFAVVPLIESPFTVASSDRCEPILSDSLSPTSVPFAGLSKVFPPLLPVPPSELSLKVVDERERRRTLLGMLRSQTPKPRCHPGERYATYVEGRGR
jgi:hypothetical protein